MASIMLSDHDMLEDAASAPATAMEEDFDPTKPADDMLAVTEAEMVDLEDGAEPIQEVKVTFEEAVPIPVPSVLAAPPIADSSAEMVVLEESAQTSEVPNETETLSQPPSQPLLNGNHTALDSVPHSQQAIPDQKKVVPEEASVVNEETPKDGSSLQKEAIVGQEEATDGPKSTDNAKEDVDEESKEQRDVYGDEEPAATGSEKLTNGHKTAIADEVPVMRLSYDGHDFVLFSDPDNVKSSYIPAPQASKDATSSASSALRLQMDRFVFLQPLEALLSKLREPAALGEFLQDDTEILLTFPDLDLSIGEDNVYARDVTLEDVMNLHTGCGLEHSLHIVISEGTRFINRFNALSTRADVTLSKRKSGEYERETEEGGEPEDDEDEEDEHDEEEEGEDAFPSQATAQTAEPNNELDKSGNFGGTESEAREEPDGHAEADEGGDEETPPAAETGEAPEEEEIIDYDEGADPLGDADYGDEEDHVTQPSKTADAPETEQGKDVEAEVVGETDGATPEAEADDSVAPALATRKRSAEDDDEAGDDAKRAKAE